MSTADYDSVRKAFGENEIVVVKCKYGDEIRRIPIMQIPTYDELCFILQRLFKGKGLSSNVDNYILRYRDDEGDLVSLSDDVDIQHAISQSTVLRVTVFDKSVATVGSLTRTTMIELKTALKKLQSDLDTVIASLPEKEDLRQEPKRQSTSQPLSTADMQELLGAKKEQTTTTDIAPIAPPPQPLNPVTASPAPLASLPKVESPKWTAPAPQRRTSTSSVYSTTSAQPQSQAVQQPQRQSQQYSQPQYSQQSNGNYPSQPSQYPPTSQPHQYPASLQPSGGQSPSLYPPNTSAPPTPAAAQSQAQSQPQQYPPQNHYQGAYQNLNQQQGQGQTTPQPYAQQNSNYYQRQSYAGPPAQSQTPSQAPVQMPYAPAHTPQPQQRPQYGLPPVQGQQQYRY